MMPSASSWKISSAGCTSHRSSSALLAWGPINGAVLTAFYMKERACLSKAFIVNHYTGSPNGKDNIRMIEKLSGKPVLAVVGDNAELLQADAQALIQLYQ